MTSFSAIDEEGIELSNLGYLLTKPEKTDDDAMSILSEIKKFKFYENFFAQNLKGMDMSNILDLCKNFKYETLDMGKVVFKQGDASDNKFYVIISGEVAVTIQQNVGDWGKLTVVMKAKKKVTGNANPNPNETQGVQNAQNTDGSKQKPEDSRSGTVKLPNPGDLTSRSNGTLTNLDEKTPNNEEGGPIKINLSKVLDETNKKEETPSTVKGKTPLNEGESPSNFGTIAKSVAILRRGMTKKVEEQVQEEPEQNEEDGPDQETREFEEFAQRFGKVVRYLQHGEGFGELALKKNAPRSATILTKTKCEFLVLMKQHYDGIFGKMEREREEFLKSSFPLLTTSVTSSANMNFLLFFFKTETYPRGAYLTTEGKTNSKEPKFFIIQHGECAVEKKLLLSLANPYDRRKTVLSNYETLQVSNAGRGILVGEEILETEDEYEYSVRVLSESCVVQAITKKDFYKFPKDFHTMVLTSFQSKKKQRSHIFEISKKENESKIEHFRNDNIYCLKNANIVSLVKKSSIQGFSKSMQRERQSSPQRALFVSPSNKHPENNLGGHMHERDEKTIRNDTFEHQRRSPEKEERPKLELPKPRKIENQDSNQNVPKSPQIQKSEISPTKTFEKKQKSPDKENFAVEKPLHNLKFATAPVKDVSKPLVHHSKQRTLRSKKDEIGLDPVEAKIEFLVNKQLSKPVEENDELKKLNKIKFFTEENDETIRRLNRVREVKLGKIKDTDMIKYPKMNVNSADILLNKFLDHKDRLELIQEQIRDSENGIFPTSPNLNLKSFKSIELPSIFDDPKFTRKSIKKGLGLSSHVITENLDEPYYYPTQGDLDQTDAASKLLTKNPVSTHRIYSPDGVNDLKLKKVATQTFYSPRAIDMIPKKTTTTTAAELKKKVFKKAPKLPAPTSTSASDLLPSKVLP